MTAIANLPGIRPSLLLDFANSARVDPRIQCTRASAATCWGPDGKLRTVPANVPRIDYDPATGKCLGLLVEEARMNLVPRSGDMAHTSWLKTNCLVADSETLTKDVALRKVTGAVGESNTHLQHTVGHTSVGTAYTLSAVVMAAGMPFVQLRILGAVSAVTRATFDLSTGVVHYSVNVSHATIQNLGAGMYRVRIGFATTQTGNINCRVQISLDAEAILPADGVSGVYVGAVQLEQGVSPTSYIPAAESAVTRAADLPEIPAGLLSVFGTLLLKYRNAGWRHTNVNLASALDLSKRIDTGLQINDHIERVVLYPRPLTATEIARLTA